MPEPLPPRSPHRQQPNPSKATANNGGQPVFAQPHPSPDPTSFRHPVTDQKDQEIAQLEPVPQPVGGAVEPILTLGPGVRKRRQCQDASHRTSGTNRVSFCRRHGQRERTGHAIAGGRQNGDGLRRDELCKRAVVFVSSGRCGLLFRRRHILLRSVLRAISKLSSAHCRHPWQS